jgi:hypothetical protein
MNSKSHGRSIGVKQQSLTHSLTILRCEFAPRSGEVYSIPHYVIKFVSVFRQVCCFLRYISYMFISSFHQTENQNNSHYTKRICKANITIRRNTTSKAINRKTY